jgi:diguanylate cyclase (GGDEF)-like protein/PAS domain S-box-containing protein
MKTLNKRINLMTFIIFICIIIFVYVSLLSPLKKRQEAASIQNFELNALNQHQVVDEFVGKMISQTKSISSRSRIRDALVAYKNNEIRWEELQEITYDKYRDGIEVINHFEYVARMVDNQILVSFGDETLLNPLELPSTASTYVLYDKAAEIIIVKNPIIREDVFLGYDILCVSMKPIFEKIQNSDHEIWIETNISENRTRRQDGIITVARSFDNFRGTFYVRMYEEVLFKDARDVQLRIFAYSILALIMMFILLDIIVVKYAKSIVRQIDESKNDVIVREEENRRLINEMNKGFAVFEVLKHDDKNTIKYRFQDVNRTFEEITGMEKEKILDKTLDEVMFVHEQNWVVNLDHVVSEKTTLAFQVHMDFNNKWYRISAYMPKDNQLALMMDDISESIKVQNRLAHSEQQMRLTLDVIGEGIWDWNMHDGNVYHNRKWCEIVGVDPMLGQHTKEAFMDFIHDEDRQMVQERLNNAVLNDEPYYSEHRLVRADGTVIWVLDRGALVYDDSSDGPVRMIGSILNVTKRKRVEEALSQEKEVFKTTLLSVGDGVIATDVYGYISFMNLEAERMTNWDDEEVQGKPLEHVFKLIDEETNEVIEKIIEDYIHSSDTDINRKLILESRNGQRIPIQETIAPIQEEDEGTTKGFVIAFRDVTEQRERQRQIEELSFNDYLTGLYNRRYMEDSIRRLDTNRNLPMAIMALDINGLKMANDAFGHEVGDQLIQAAAKVIKTACREEDIVARTGGDEFMVLLPKTTSENAEMIKRRILLAAKKEHVNSIGVSIAIGYSVKEEEAEDIYEIQKLADKHMYKHKMKSSKKMKLSMISMAMENIQQNYETEEVHTERVAEFCSQILEAMDFSQEDIDEIYIAGTLHDIGKIILPPELLNKKGKLTQEEVEQLHRYPEAGYQILKNTDEYTSIADDVLHHHERFDGKGYPSKLKGENIPFNARVIAVADAYEAMTGDRTYKQKMRKDEAIQELKKNSGTQFDPEIVDVFIHKVLLKKD